jgi:hypothetical protein
VHALLGALLDALLRPVSGLTPEFQAGALGLPAALLALAVHRASADQGAIARAKDRMKGHLLELRLFRDDLRGLLRAQGLFLRHNAVYLGRSLVPLALLAGPFLLLLAQVEHRFGWSALPPGQSALLTADVDAVGRLADLPLRLDAPGLRVESGPLRIEQTRQLVWRLVADPAPGERRLELRVADRPVALRALVEGAGARRVTPAVYRADQPQAWLAPGATPLAPDAPLRRVALAYPRHGAAWLGLSRASWIFTASTLVFAFALRRPLGVEL